jgi:hypothetical protein
MENADIDEEARINAKRDYENTIMEMNNLTTQNTIDNLNLQKEAVEQQIEMYSDLANSIGDIFGSIADILEDDIKRKVENGEITEEEGEKQFKAVKAFQIAQATYRPFLVLLPHLCPASHSSLNLMEQLSVLSRLRL